MGLCYDLLYMLCLYVDKYTILKLCSVSKCLLDIITDEGFLKEKITMEYGKRYITTETLLSEFVYRTKYDFFKNKYNSDWMFHLSKTLKTPEEVEFFVKYGCELPYIISGISHSKNTTLRSQILDKYDWKGYDSISKIFLDNYSSLNNLDLTHRLIRGGLYKYYGEIIETHVSKNPTVGFEYARYYLKNNNAFPVTEEFYNNYQHVFGPITLNNIYNTYNIYGSCIYNYMIKNYVKNNEWSANLHKFINEGQTPLLKRQEFYDEALVYILFTRSYDLLPTLLIASYNCTFSYGEFLLDAYFKEFFEFVCDGYIPIRPEKSVVDISYYDSEKLTKFLKLYPKCIGIHIILLHIGDTRCLDILKDLNLIPKIFVTKDYANVEVPEGMEINLSPEVRHIIVREVENLYEKFPENTKKYLNAMA